MRNVNSIYLLCLNCFPFSFILTMRNVNKEKVIEGLKKMGGFILTMRNVN